MDQAVTGKLCAWCGSPLTKVNGPNQKYHLACSKQAARAKAVRKKGPAQGRNELHVEQVRRELEQRALTRRWCGTCHYGMKFNESGTSCCNYMEMMGHRRPCPNVLRVGGPCEVYQPLTRKRVEREGFHLKWTRRQKEG